MTKPYTVDFAELTRGDVARVGGKNASLGEMIGALSAKDIAVPPGFATEAEAYRVFLRHNHLQPVISGHLDALAKDEADLASSGLAIRRAIEGGAWPEAVENAIRSAYRELAGRLGKAAPSVAVRSSATAEDLPDASFAGQQATFLNVVGEDALLDACRKCFASLYTDRAITYREAHGFAHESVALSIGIQQMVRADLACSGVMFSVDTETGFPDLVMIDATWGLGENIVQGAVDPDSWEVFKPLLADPSVTPIISKQLGSKAKKMVYAENGGATTRNIDTSPGERDRFVLGDEEVMQLARWAVVIEQHYGCAMDMEWAKDGPHGDLYIVQARPETVQSRAEEGAISVYTMHTSAVPVLTGLAIGHGVASGTVCRIDSPADIDRFVDGAILVTGTTDPDWVPIMQRAAAIITDHGGRTSHAAIVAREFGLPAIVGTHDATRLLHGGQEVTVSCIGGDKGAAYVGLEEFSVRTLDFAALPKTRTKIMLNMAEPSAAMRWWRLPSDGVGLTRMEFVIANEIRVHPMALVNPASIGDDAIRSEIGRLTRHYSDPAEYFVDRLSRSLSRIAAVQYPNPAIIRMSDFKTNEYASLIGGTSFEPEEENPMIGFRGASRYYSDLYRAGFALECRAMRRLREDLGFTNAAVMIPFCRTLEEADRVLDVMAENGLRRGENGLEIYMMCEIPSNVVLAGQFAERFDGFSIGSNDLTQLTLGIDRDSDLLADAFDERDPAVEWMIRHTIAEAHRHGCKVGLCGQAPSDHPEFARFLVESGIDSISVTPDSFVDVKQHVSEAEEEFAALVEAGPLAEAAEL